MKTERRHELEENDLAHRLESLVVKARGNGTTILTVIVAAVFAYFAVTIWISRGNAARGAAWSQYMEAVQSGVPDVALLEELVASQPGSDVGAWARAVLADVQAADGMENLFADREAANNDLNAAAEHYRVLIESATRQELIDRARVGLARVLEAQNNLDEAKSHYERLASADETNPFQAFAQERLEQLNASGGDFYDWFASAKPSRLPSTGPLGGDMSFDLDSVPDDPPGVGTDGNSSLLDLGTPEAGSELPEFNPFGTPPDAGAEATDGGEGDTAVGTGDEQTGQPAPSDAETPETAPESSDNASETPEQPTPESGGDEQSDASEAESADEGASGETTDGPSLGQPEA